MLFGTGLAFYLGKPLIQPQAPHAAGDLSSAGGAASPPCATRSRSTCCSWSGAALAPAILWALRSTRWGMIVRMVGDRADAARAMGYSVDLVRLAATVAGGFLAGIGGSFLSLYYPGSWSEGLSSGQGITAVALVIFARWSPMNCFYASLLFGGAGALGPALQSVGVTSGYYLFNAAPYFLTLFIMILTSSSEHRAVGRAVRAEHHALRERAWPSATSPPIPIPGPITAICGPRTPR